MTNDTSNTKKVITRFAPSPTGFMHIGGVRTALFAYLHARKNNGIFILRIEDTDKNREVEGSIEHIKESLKWLGLEWDYGPDSKTTPFGSCIQSERLDSYLHYAKILVEKDLAYPDPYTPEQVEAFRNQTTAEKRPFLFRGHRPETSEVWDGTKPLRLKVPEIKRYTWNDVVRGELSAGEEMLDDVVLIKSDGYPTYNFAHIIDDHEMGVTHIMRADEFIASTPKFLSIYDALGFERPEFVTLPPILREDKTKKLGKRDGAKDILEYRDEGYLPEAMVNFLALTGWNPGTEQELFTKDDLIATFDITKIQRAGALLNEDKLLWMNKQYISNLSPEEKFSYVSQYLTETVTNLPQFSQERLTRSISTIIERISIGKEIKDLSEAGEYDYLFASPEYETTVLKWKNDDSAAEALPRLEKALETLSCADFGSMESIKSALWPLAEELGKGQLLWPLRVALSGQERSPDPFTLAFILGPEETILRIKTACDKIRA
jgi:glutamyl-tRNA synthetase